MTFFFAKDGRAILPLGLQTHNSSTGVPEMLEREIAAVKHYGGNLLEAPVYWYRIEDEQDHFNWVRQHLNLMQEIGMENYLIEQLGE